MLRIKQSHSLRDNNTFRVNIVAEHFAEPENTDELKFALRYADEQNMQCLIIGEGSNLLFQSNFKGLIIHPRFDGIKKVSESENEVLIKAGAGVNWDSFVSHCVDHGYYGTENLSLIPGSVGAAPVQNIGAYGVEAKDVIESVDVYDRKTASQLTLSNQECDFSYRDSIFKRSAKNRYIITSVVFKLQKNGAFKLDYGNVKKEFLSSPDQNLKSLRELIISIRQQKLPDHKIYGNAGSFFKNPIIDTVKFEQLLSVFDEVPNYPANKKQVKIPSAWLIEKSGWKGKREGQVGTWPHQPLVIVNYGNATGKEIFNFSEKIRRGVINKFGIDLEREVTLID